MKNDEKFMLYTIIVFLASALLLALSFLFPIPITSLHTFILGALLLSGLVLFFSLTEKIKSKRENNKFKKKMKLIHDQTRSPIDAPYFAPKEGNYYNEGNSYSKQLNGVHLKVNNIITVVEEYAASVPKNEFILFLCIPHILGESRELAIRRKTTQLGGKIVIVKDISSWSTPDGIYDTNTITAKLPISSFKAFFDLFDPPELEFISICDDYNPNIFSERDTYLAINENFRFKFWFDKKSLHYALLVKYGHIKNTESYVEKLISIILR